MLFRLLLVELKSYLFNIYTVAGVLLDFMETFTNDNSLYCYYPYLFILALLQLIIYAEYFKVISILYILKLKNQEFAFGAHSGFVQARN